MMSLEFFVKVLGMVIGFVLVLRFVVVGELLLGLCRV